MSADHEKMRVAVGEAIGRALYHAPRSNIPCLSDQQRRIATQAAMVAIVESGFVCVPRSDLDAVAAEVASLPQRTAEAVAAAILGERNSGDQQLIFHQGQEIERLQKVIEVAAEAIERGSTTAPLLEYLKAAKR